MCFWLTVRWGAQRHIPIVSKRKFHCKKKSSNGKYKDHIAKEKLPNIPIRQKSSTVTRKLPSAIKEAASPSNIWGVGVQTWWFWGSSSLMTDTDSTAILHLEVFLIFYILQPSWRWKRLPAYLCRPCLAWTSCSQVVVQQQAREREIYIYIYIDKTRGRERWDR